jgi:hypothetical protein
MREVSDAYLFAVAEVSATLIGLFLVGVFFYAETGFPRLGAAREAFEPYLRAGIRITLVVLAIPLLLPLTLVAMEPIWSRLLYVLLSAVLVVTLVDIVRRVPAVWASTRSRWLVGMEIVMTVGSVGVVVLALLLGGLEPSRVDLNWPIILAGVGFLSVSTTVLSVFDFGRASLDTAQRTASGEPNESRASTSPRHARCRQPPACAPSQVTLPG